MNKDGRLDLILRYDNGRNIYWNVSLKGGYSHNICELDGIDFPDEISEAIATEYNDVDLTLKEFPFVANSTSQVLCNRDDKFPSGLFSNYIEESEENIKMELIRQF